MPHSIPTKDVIYQRAESARELAAAHAAEAEDQCQLSEALVTSMIDQQLFSIVAPLSQNGLEMDIDVLLDAAKIVGRGCGSAAWVLSLLGTHNWIGGMFPQQAQQEMFDGRGYLLAPAIFAPGGAAHAVEGGFNVSGKWAFASGIRHANWVMLSSAELNAEDQMVGMHCLVLPIEEVTILPTWDTVGMRGTGSCDVQVDDVFVPSHRSIPFSDLLNGTSIGAKESNNPIYRIPLIAYLAYTALAPVIGMGKGALAIFQDYLEQRLLMSGKNQKTSVAAQIRLATASNKIAAAEALMDQGVAALISSVKNEKKMTIADRVRYRSEACYCASLVKEAVNELAAGAGAKAQFKDHPLQKFQRDINTISGHIVFDMDTTMELQGRVQLGMEPANPLV